MNKLNVIKKRGISGIISTVLMLALVFVLIGVVWGVVSSVVNKNVDSTEACFNLYGKLEIGNDFTCYNSSSKELQFSILRKDLELDEILISIENSGGSKPITLSKELKIVKSVKKKGAGYGTSINIPGKNSGKTYVANLSELGLENPIKISIAPRVGKTLCEISDVLEKIDDCSVLLNQ